MKLKLLTASLLAATAIAGTASAQQAYNWTGIYAGVNLGGVWQTSCPTLTPTVDGQTVTLSNGNCPGNSSFMGGGQLGYNYQAGPWVLGLEGDIGGATSVSSARTFTTAGSGTVPGVPAGTYTLSGWHTPGAIFTIRARAGYAWDRALIYVTGGGAFAGSSGGGSVVYTDPTGADTATFSGGNSGTRSGWTIGGGVEYNVTGRWSVKVEDLYAQLGNLSVGTGCGDNTGGATCALFPAVNWASNNSRLDVNIFRVGVNYNFGGF